MKPSVLILMIASAGCSGSKSAPSAVVHDAAPATVVTSDAAAEGIPILVDGKPIARVPLAKIADPIELSAVIDVPQSDWKVVEGYASEHRTLALRKPLETYPDQMVMLFTGDKGKPCFGTFLRPDRATPEQKHLLGSPRLFVRGIVEVRIRTEEQALPAPAPAVIEIVVGEKVTEVSSTELAALPAIDSSEQPTWKLSDVVGLVSRRRADKLIVTGGDRSSVEIPGKALRDRAQAVTLKRNRRGLYKLQWLDQSTKPPKLVGEMRAVQRIEVR